MHHPDRVVERVVVDYEPGVAGALEHLDEVAQQDVLLHGDDVRARHHHVLDPPLAQAEDVLEHRALFRRKPGFAGSAGLEHHLEVGANRAGLPAEPGAQHPHEPAGAVPGGLADAGHGNGELVALAAGAGRLVATGRVGLRHRSRN